MQYPELDNEGEADEGECVKTNQEERRPRGGSVSQLYAPRGCTQPSILVSQERTGKTSENENYAKNAKGRINFGF